ncbi:hypothetical protein HAX54_017682 [Datura stramonium]|uniref:Aminotransferase-like plant mobile domain-containing protein n=1 Tax=Datura stramonium TaxID=4076 RepID=A0ABS8Y6V0_DATST|nr:hypothetical protein [Datura stramonium]
MATMMAIKWNISLAVPVLASIYNGLNEISSLPELELIRICFPIHYVYGWLAHYFMTHYALANVPSNSLMVAFSGEGVARYFDKKEARKRIHLGDNIAWTSTVLNNSEPYDYIDNYEAQALESNYFMSIRFGYLFLRNENSTIIEPYSLHQFSRQFGLYQRIPGALANDNRSALLAEGLRYWRICMLDKSMSRVTFPPNTPNMKKIFLGQFLPRFRRLHIKNVAIQYHKLDIPLLHWSCHLSNAKAKDLSYLNKLPLKKCMIKIVRVAKALFPLSIVVHVSKKRSSPCESNSSHEDRCWKKVRPRSDKSGDANLAMVEIHDSVDSPSRTLTVLIKESNGSGALPRERSQKSGESISGSNPIKSPSIGKTEKKATSAPRDRVKARLSSDLQKHPTTAVSVFDGKKVVLSNPKMFISELWTVIWGKLSGSDVDCVSSLKEEVQVILDEMDAKDVDVSPLMKLLKSFFEFATIYDQARSALHDKDMEAARKEFSIIAGECLSNAMLEEYEKIEKVSSIRQF